MNSIQLTGRLCADIELRRTGDGTAVASYSIAVKRPMSKDTTDFLNVVTWRQGAEFLAQYAHKGDLIGVTGSLQTRDWQDKEGNKHRAYEVVTDRVELLSSRRPESGAPAPQPQRPAPQPQYPAQQPPQQQSFYRPESGNPAPQPPQQQSFYRPPVQQMPYAELTDDDGQLPF